MLILLKMIYSNIHFSKVEVPVSLLHCKKGFFCSLGSFPYNVSI